MQNYIAKQVEESYQVKKAILDDPKALEAIQSFSQKVVDTYKAGNKMLIAGNGGSAADAQHIAAEIVARFYFDRPGLPALALTTDTSILTAVGNDYGYEHLFARQVQANGNKGDMFIGISTSGNSSNILKALEECKAKGIYTVGLTGQSGGQMKELCDFCITVPSNDTPRIQEAHILIGHILCGLVESNYFSNN